MIAHRIAKIHFNVERKLPPQVPLSSPPETWNLVIDFVAWLVQELETDVESRRSM